MGLIVAACGGESKQAAGGGGTAGTGGKVAHETCDPPHFADPGVEAALGPSIAALGVDSVRTAMLHQVSSLAGLECLTALETLTVHAGTLSELAPIRGLTELRTVELYDVPVRDLGPFAGLSKLSSLALSGTAVAELGPIADLPSLVVLDASRSEVVTVAPLQGLATLKVLTATDSPLASLDPLLELPLLEGIDVSRSGVERLPLFGTPPGSCPTIRALETSLDIDTVIAIIPTLCGERGWTVTWSSPGGEEQSCGPPCELHP